MSVRALLGDGGALSRELPGYESRPEQLAMALAVEEAIDHGAPLLVEAGTGTGKSLAYLVPAVLSGQRVVVSTATKALGEQLVERDLPLLSKLGLHPEVALVKGLGNYVCLRRLEEYRRTATARKPDPHLNSLLAWIDGTETGDRSDLDAVPEDAEIWREVSSSSDTRIGTRCPHYDRCFVTRMKRRAEAASIIVTNHHLFCADLALRSAGFGAQALPDFDAVIFDEAHALEEVATEFFGIRITRARLEHVVRDVARAFEQAGLFGDHERSMRVGRLMAVVSGGGQELFTHFARVSARPGDPVGGRQLLRADTFDGPLGESASAVIHALGELHTITQDFVGQSDALVALSRRLRTVRDSLQTVVDGTNPSHVAYCEPEARGGGAVGACPVEVGPILREQLWSRGGAVILTSATLSTAGESGFAFVRQRLGVPDDARELFLESPFDYGAQAALYVPRSICEPRDAEYVERASEEIRRLVSITQGGAFVLCTSVRHMRAFAAELRHRWEHPTFVQGEAPKARLLSKFREAGDAVLFATASFWEGVDVPGRALRLVIMDKLPFEVPSDPVVAARIQRLTEQGQEPFIRYQLPVAALALKQGFGRLIRTRRDSGIVAVLDRRLVTRGYGKQLMAALPPASRCASVDEVKAFWESVG